MPPPSLRHWCHDIVVYSEVVCHTEQLHRTVTQNSYTDMYTCHIIFVLLSFTYLGCDVDQGSFCEDKL